MGETGEEVRGEARREERGERREERGERRDERRETRDERREVREEKREERWEERGEHPVREVGDEMGGGRTTCIRAMTRSIVSADWLAE